MTQMASSGSSSSLLEEVRAGLRAEHRPEAGYENREFSTPHLLHVLLRGRLVHLFCIETEETLGGEESTVRWRTLLDEARSEGASPWLVVPFALRETAQNLRLRHGGLGRVCTYLRSDSGKADRFEWW